MRNQLKILLVEDEIINAMLLSEQLESIGYAVANHVTTGENAITSVKRCPPNIILMDIGLAGEIDGIEAAAVIKTESDIPIVFITGYDDQTIRERAEKLKPCGYLLKPFEIDELKIIIDSSFALEK